MDNTVDPNCPRCGQAPQTLEHWLDCPGTLQARLEIFGTTEAQHSQLFRASRSHWQDALCDHLVCTPSTTTAAAAAVVTGVPVLVSLCKLADVVSNQQVAASTCRWHVLLLM